MAASDKLGHQLRQSRCPGIKSGASILGLNELNSGRQDFGLRWNPEKGIKHRECVGLLGLSTMAGNCREEHG
jgi:hypothetical protein